MCSIGDRGVRGLVIRPRGGHIEQIDGERVRADAPTTINGLVRWTVQRGIAGLEAWAGTPGTVGGAIFGNAHFGGPADWRSRRIGASRRHSTATTRDLSRDEMEFGYDRSRLQKTGEVLLSAVFRVSTGDPAALRDVARQSLAYRKKTQPLDTPSAGCIFQNPDRVGRACRHSGFCRRARRSGRAEGDVARRCPRVADARQFHRQRRTRDGCRHSRAHRSVPRARAASGLASRCRKRSSTWETFDVESVD